MGERAFSELRVVELAGAVGGAWAAKLFADLGAQVVKVEPPGGDPMRSCGEPLPGGTGTLSAFLDTSKRSVVVDLSGDGGSERLQALLADADVVIESSAPDPLHPVAADLGGAGLVRVLLSPYGMSGPYAGHRSTSLTDEAASGHLFLTGDPARQPLRGPGLQSAYAAGGLGFVGAMAALWSRRRTGEGQTVEVSQVEAMITLHQFTFVKYTHGGEVLRRLGNRYAGPGNPMGAYACADGSVSLSVPAGPQVRRLLELTGLTGLLDLPQVASLADLQADPHLIDDALRPWMSSRPVREVVAVLQAARVPVAPTLTMTELLEDEHLAVREFWQEVDGLRHPGPPFRLGRRPWVSRPAPAAGELDLGRPGGAWPPAADGPAGNGAGTTAASSDGGPLAGLRVLDLTRVWAGPLAARILADLGADVVMVEAPWARGGRAVPAAAVQASRMYPANTAGEHPWNRNGFLNEYARNKRSLALDVAAPTGRALLERLVVTADVLMENYSARVMPQLGLAEDHLHDLNPGLVYITMPGFGRTGPGRDWVAYGNVVDGHAGMTSLTGYEGEEPWKSGVAWPDAIAGVHAAAATLVALWDREHDASHRGDTVEVAQMETLVATLGHEVLAAQARGGDRLPYGNRHPSFAPQGVYPTAGPDCWIALSVTDDGAWQGLCDLAGLDSQLRAMDVDERRARHDVVDEALSRFTREHDHRTLAERLQRAGVAAAAVLDAPGVMSDPHVVARGLFVTVDHEDVGPMKTAALPVRLSADAVRYRPAPLLGQHGRAVLQASAGVDDREYAELVAAGVVAESPPP